MMKRRQRVGAAMVLAGLLAVTAASAASTSLAVPDDVQYFPGTYYRSRGRANVAWFVLSRWPGPESLIRLWRSGRLDQRQRVAWLLGAAAFHDPVLLPVYREALNDAREKVREAAAFGFRDLLAAPVPHVEEGIGPTAAGRFRWELAAVENKLVTRDLVGFWLDRLTEPESATNGVYRHRAALRALDVLLEPEDLPELTGAYLRIRSRSERMALLPLMQAMTGRRIILMPRGQRAGWGPSIYRFAARSLEGWLAHRCDFSPRAVLRVTLGRYGMRRLDPMGAGACRAWLEVLRRGRPCQWPLASRQLYRCGGPPVFISMLRSGSEHARQQRASLLKWFGTGVRRRIGEAGGR